MKVWMVTTEVAPFVSEYPGAAEIADLARSLQQIGVEVSIFMPFYREAAWNVHAYSLPISEAGIEVSLTINQQKFTGQILKSRLPDSEVEVYLLSQKQLYDRPRRFNSPWGDYPDNMTRLAFLARAAIDILPTLSLEPDIIQVFGWKTAIIPLYCKTQYRHWFTRQPATVITIDRPDQRGIFWHLDMNVLGLEWGHYNPGELEFNHQLSLLKGGIVYADNIVLPGMTAAEEVLSPDYGFGLEGLYQARADRLSGINFGWQPSGDMPTAKQLGDEKARVKKKLQQRLNLKVDPDIPLALMRGSLDVAHGVDLAVAALRDVPAAEMQVVFAGKTDHEVGERLQALICERGGGTVVQASLIGDDQLAEFSMAADFILVPSRHEPCGLEALKPMAWGALPVARQTGGLADRLVPLKEPEGNAILFAAPTEAAFAEALQNALAEYRQPRQKQTLASRAAATEFSLGHAASQYQELYRRAIHG